MPMSRRTSTGCGKRFCICCSGVSFCGSSAASAGKTGSAEINPARPSATAQSAEITRSRVLRVIGPLLQIGSDDLASPSWTDVIAVKSTERHRRRLHPAALRVMHWVNALAMIVLIGVWAQHALQWHFLAMCILMLNGICYLVYGFASGRVRRKLVPIWPSAVLAEMRAALRFQLAHDDIRHYNAVQKLLYAGVIVVIVVQVLSGWAIWKPMQLSELTRLFYDFQGARLVHFLGMVAIVGFLVVHVLLAMLVPKTIAAMVTGGPP